MRSIIFSYMLIFFSFSNILITSHNHEHKYIDSEDFDECDECIFYENSKNIIIHDKEFLYKNNFVEYCFFKLFKSIYIDVAVNRKSRAPPIS